MKNLITIAILTAVLFLAGCGSNDQVFWLCGTLPQPSAFGHNYKSPGGVKIKSVVEVPVDVLPLFDEGISNQIQRTSAAYPAWSKYKKLSDYEVYLIDPMGISVNLPGAPLLISACGVVETASGTVIGPYGNDAKIILLPHQRDQNWGFRDYLGTSAWYESEHVREYQNDRNVFASFLGDRDIHPHFP